MNLETPLVKFSNDPCDWWKVRDAFEGIQIFGGIGSGKTSGSGKKIAGAFLKNGFGGLVMCAKKGEAVDWLEYSIQHSRWEDVIVFGKKNKYELWEEHLSRMEDASGLTKFRNGNSWASGNLNRFNPLQYEMTRRGEGAGQIFNLSYLFMELYKMGNRFSGGGDAGESERFWDTALKRCLNNTFQLLMLADEEISIKNMRTMISSAPTESEFESLRNMSEEEYLDWINENSYCCVCLNNASLNLSESNEDEFHLVQDYFLRQFLRMPDKTRSTIEESFLGLIEPFTRGILKTYFSEETNLLPEVSFEGKIIILDFPVKEYMQAGVYAQAIFKLMWQQAIERRDTRVQPKPTFLWVDESQYFVSEYDTIFQTTARSSRACTVFLTQNVSNYYAQMGGEKSKSKVNSLLGNLSTKIFHCNNDTTTNEWASDVIGKNYIVSETKSENRAQFGVIPDSLGRSKTQLLLPQVLPVRFTTLKTGGEHFDLKVEAVIQVKGKIWSNDLNYTIVEFSQTTS